MSETFGSAAARRNDDAAPSGHRHRRIAWLVALLLGASCAGALGSLVGQARDGASFDVHGWRDGSVGRSLDRAIDVPFAHTLHRWQAAARYRFFGATLGTRCARAALAGSSMRKVCARRSSRATMPLCVPTAAMH
nr:hypothetical protein [Paraburkholderia sp. BL8N3]